ncbi:unnamed protein product [Protopolystoma xenopodis]|uniref:Uncharacterized protein n=1 Tax=Protopolystoma xenopodis TaxID=117903 RepID=A0A448WIV9_9PLAT|nr:unnamed protein product [Protopolystoma xenopodis]
MDQQREPNTRLPREGMFSLATTASAVGATADGQARAQRVRDTATNNREDSFGKTGPNSQTECVGIGFFGGLAVYGSLVCHLDKRNKPFSAE